MLLVLPVSYEYETSMTPKQIARKLDGEIIPHVPTLNILSTGKFMKSYRMESVYYGRRTSKNDFQLFYHQAKKRDGGSTGFYGTIEKTKTGAKISGKFRKPAYTYVFAIIWTLAVLFLALMMFAIEEKTGAIVTAVIWAVGFFLMFWDNSKKYLRAYIETFPNHQGD